MLVGLPNGCPSMRVPPRTATPQEPTSAAPDAAAIVRRAPWMVVAFDPRERLVLLNPAAAAALGAVEEWTGRTCEELGASHPLFAHWAPHVHLAAERGDAADAETEVAAGASVTLVRSRIVPSLAPDGRIDGVLAYAEDVGAARRRLHVDALSGVSHREEFLRQLEGACARLPDGRDPSFAVLFVDLDGFKAVNDRLGHAAGDAVLRIVGERLLGSVRGGDVVGRLGGDEFAVLLRGVPRAPEAVGVVRRLLSRLEEPMEVSGARLRVTGSVGVVVGGGGSGPREILGDADRAMYSAKGLGEGQYEVSDEVTASFAAAVEGLEGELERAIAGEQLVLHYQPIVSLDDGRVVALEALVRWDHPQRGLLRPQAFLPVAERSGLAARLDGWVLRSVARQVRLWIDDHGGTAVVPVSVNLSVRSAAWADLARDVERAIGEHDLPAGAIAAEIGEGAVPGLGTAGRAFLAALRESGVPVYLDGFGTGPVSLAQLRRLPLDALKIDRSIVRRLTFDPGDRAIVEGIVAVGRALGLSVIAGGIETARQHEALRALGCVIGQGFLFGRAERAAEARPALRRDGGG
jgi:diguanylate cyclase